MGDMPERIWAGRVDGFGGWHEGPDFVNNVEYIRADLVAQLRADLDAANERAEKAERDHLARVSNEQGVWVDRAKAAEADAAALLGKLRAIEDATDMAINRLEVLSDTAWNGDARDFKRNMQGIFAEYQEARRAALAPDPAAVPGKEGE